MRTVAIIALLLVVIATYPCLAVEGASVDPVQVVILVDVSGSMAESTEDFIGAMKLMYELASVNQMAVSFEFCFFSGDDELHTVNEDGEKSLKIITVDTTDMSLIALRAEQFAQDLREAMRYNAADRMRYTHLLESLEDFEATILQSPQSVRRLLIFSDMCADYYPPTDKRNNKKREMDINVAALLARWKDEDGYRLDYRVIPWDGPDETPAFLRSELGARLEATVRKAENESQRLEIYGRFMGVYHWLAHGYVMETDVRGGKPGSACPVREDTFSLLLLRLPDASIPALGADTSHIRSLYDEQLGIEMIYYQLPTGWIDNSQRPQYQFDTEYRYISIMKPNIVSVNVAQNNIRYSAAQEYKWSRAEPVDIIMETDIDFGEERRPFNAWLQTSDGENPRSYRGVFQVGGVITFQHIPLKRYDHETFTVWLSWVDTSWRAHEFTLATENQVPVWKGKERVFPFGEPINLQDYFVDLEGDAITFRIEGSGYTLTEKGYLLVDKPDEQTAVLLTVMASDSYTDRYGRELTASVTLTFKSDADIPLPADQPEPVRDIGRRIAGVAALLFAAVVITIIAVKR